MNDSAFRKKVLHAGFMPQALAYYLVKMSVKLKPETRARIAGKIDESQKQALVVGEKAMKAMEKLRMKSKQFSKSKKAA